MAGCASLSSEECLKAAAEPHGWDAVGHSDGASGQPASRLARHGKACEGVQVVPDQSDYLRGWERGKRLYCTFENARDVGADGRTFHVEVCGLGAEASAELQRHWRRGWVDARIVRAESELRSLQRELERTTEVRVYCKLDPATGRKADSGCRDKDPKADLRNRISSLENELWRLRRE